MIKNIGVDIVKISRIQFNIKEKVLSKDELELFNKMKEFRQREFLAGRFALKEAIYKAGIKISYPDMNIKYNKDNSIYLENYDQVRISLSHEKEFAIGFCINQD